MKQFDIPDFYRSSIIGKIKNARKLVDPRKKDFSPSLMSFGPVEFLIPRHFGFCYGVENAIEISYKAIEENPGKKIYLLSQMIHNPAVNEDLVSRGIDFIMDTYGNQLIPWDNVTKDDIVIIPAFGTTVEVNELLDSKGIETKKYNTTCPFVEKVWKRSQKLGEDKFTVIIHGKAKHEETRATFSHSYQGAPSLIIKNMGEAEKLAGHIRGEKKKEEFYDFFAGKFSEGFDPEKHLRRLGVVNQTTMLASETQAIADFIKQTIIEVYGEASYKDHFADTRDTLCYATNDNQQATYGVLKERSDLAVVVGGYNSSNTSHIVELCEQKVPTYFIKDASEIKSQDLIHHFNYPKKEIGHTHNWLPQKERVRIVLTSGASCPDSTVDEVMKRIVGFYEGAKSIEEAIALALSE